MSFVANIENMDKSTDLILKELLKVSSLDDDGKRVIGGVKHAYLKLELFFQYFNYKRQSGDNWGNIITRVDIEEYEAIDQFYYNLLQKLIDKRIVDNSSVTEQFRDGHEIKLTVNGYRLILKYENDQKEVDLFTKEQSEKKQEDARPNEQAPKLIKFNIPIENIPNLRGDLLNIVNVYTSTYDQKIHKGELCIRYLSTFDAGIKSFTSINRLIESKIYDEKSIDEALEIINKELMESFRENLIHYDYRRTEFIDITKEGIRYLAGDVPVLPTSMDETAYEVIEILHISDLHFGSSESTNVDNKDKITVTSGFKLNSFQAFKKFVSQTNSDPYLIISGDLTTRNEEEGFKQSKKEIEDLIQSKLNEDKIYIVPGNHDYDRNEAVERQYSLFLAYFSHFYNPLIKNNYILDQEKKILIVGINSTYINEDSQEIIHFDNADMEKLEQAVDKLNASISDFDKYIKIAVVHNNLTPHPSIEVKKYSDVLNIFRLKYLLMKLGFKMVLSGHKHQALVEHQKMYIDNFEGELVLISAASLNGTVFNNRNSFQLIQLYKEKTSGTLMKTKIIKFEVNSLNEIEEQKHYEIHFD